MKITKRQLRRIIREELISSKGSDISKLVREAYAETIILSRPKYCLREGIISKKQYSTILQFRSLNESSAPIPKQLQESIGDIIAQWAEKIGEETGKAGAGIAGGMWDAMYGIANKLSGKVTGAVEDTLKWVNTNINKIVAGTGEFISGTIKGSKQAADKIAEGWKEGKDYKQLAKENPEDFLTVYKDLKKTLADMNVPVQSTELAKATLGIWSTPDGQKALKHGAKQAGMDEEELKSMLGLFVVQSRFVPLATKTLQKRKEKEMIGDAKEEQAEQKNENRNRSRKIRVTRSTLRKVIKGANLK